MIEFTFDGTIKKLTAIADCVLSFVLVGAGGAPGGYDRYGPSTGISGDTLNGKVSLKKGDILYCAVASRGLQGVGGWYTQPGGVGGTSIDGFSGGRGGNSGPSGASGSGGGGGGATVLWKNSLTPTLGEVTYTYTSVIHKSSYITGNFSPFYLIRPLATSNGFFVRSAEALTRNNSINNQRDLREWWVVINGAIVYHSTTYPPIEYLANKFISSEYALWETWPGGGDFITIYDVEERIQTPNYGSNNIVAIAAGGGGGGGGGCFGPGYISANPIVEKTYVGSMSQDPWHGILAPGQSGYYVFGRAYYDGANEGSVELFNGSMVIVVINGKIVQGVTNNVNISPKLAVPTEYMGEVFSESDGYFQRNVVQCFSFRSTFDIDLVPRRAYAYSQSANGLYDTRGAAGQYHRGDGGGAGGGGGGYRGGSGGTAPGGDTGGQAGSNGMSYLSPEVTPVYDINVGQAGSYGGNWDVNVYDNDTNGYAAFDSLQTNAFVYTKSVNGVEYTKVNTPAYYPKAPYLQDWEYIQVEDNAMPPSYYNG